MESGVDSLPKLDRRRTTVCQASADSVPRSGIA
jgi:hypothetical protein